MIPEIAVLSMSPFLQDQFRMLLGVSSIGALQRKHLQQKIGENP